jgi:hypothetical protein
VESRTYPADRAGAALRIFLEWFGRRFARSARLEEFQATGGVARAAVLVGRQWRLDLDIVDSLHPEASMAFEAARAAVEQRLDQAGHSIVLWAPRGAALPAEEPGLSRLLLALDAATGLDDGRLEVRRTVNLYLRRVTNSGSVVTILGGLAGHWAEFTNRVPGSFQLNSTELLRLPQSSEERQVLMDRIVAAAGQPLADETQVIEAEDAWTATRLPSGGSCVLGTPREESDEQAAALRRNLRALLREAAATAPPAGSARFLLLLGAATYAEGEKLSWAVRGMDPALYAGYDALVVLADGVVKPLLEPPRGSLPWDAPLA